MATSSDQLSISVELRRAWDCAFALMQDYRDRLKPRVYAMCHATLKQAPEALSLRRARRLQRVFSSLVEKRQ